MSMFHHTPGGSSSKAVGLENLACKAAALAHKVCLSSIFKRTSPSLLASRSESSLVNIYPPATAAASVIHHLLYLSLTLVFNILVSLVLFLLGGLKQVETAAVVDLLLVSP